MLNLGFSTGELEGRLAKALGWRCRLTPLNVRCTFPVFRGETPNGEALFVKVGTMEEWRRSVGLLREIGGSGLLRVVRDKVAEDISAVRLAAAAWLRTDYGASGRERQYVGMRNRIFAECLLDDGTANVPVDYKIMCSNGRPLYAWVDTGRFVDHRRTVFDLQFNRLDVRIGFPADAGTLSRPKNWDMMLTVAAELSRGIPIVRIDLYNLSGQIFFGEMTFTSGRANEITTPFEFSNRMARQADSMVRSLFASKGVD